jgi:RNA polymerase sigma-70 factor, ECF subfamily
MSELAGSVRTVPGTMAPRAPDRDAEARAWLHALASDGAEREEAAAQLHSLLLRAARFELARRRSMFDGAGRETLDDLAVQSADDALSAIVGKLDDYRFESRFTTWAYKFAILEAAVRSRRRAWHDRELPIEPEAWALLATRTPEPFEDLEIRETLREITAAIKTELSPHQREVLTAVVIADVPIDVLAQRLSTTRSALYKTLHDARRKLRAAIEDHAR